MKQTSRRAFRSGKSRAGKIIGVPPLARIPLGREGYYFPFLPKGLSGQPGSGLRRAGTFKDLVKSTKTPDRGLKRPGRRLEPVFLLRSLSTGELAPLDDVWFSADKTKNPFGIFLLSMGVSRERRGPCKSRAGGWGLGRFLDRYRERAPRFPSPAGGFLRA